MEKTVLLLHPNRYFMCGLEHLIRQWFHSQSMGVCIVHNANALEKADIIFISASYRSQKWWQRLRRVRHHPLLFLLVEQRNILCCGYEDGQIAITDRREELAALLHTFVANRQPSRASSPTRLHGIVQCLSPREREVLWGYKQGLDNHQISKKSGMSIKAISAYRNNAMQKLWLQNHADLHYWLNCIAAQSLSSYFRKKDIFRSTEKFRERVIRLKHE